MKLPEEILKIKNGIYFDEESWEAIVRDCAKVCSEQYGKVPLGRPITQWCADTILARYGLKENEGG